MTRGGDGVGETKGLVCDCDFRSTVIGSTENVTTYRHPSLAITATDLTPHFFFLEAFSSFSWKSVYPQVLDYLYRERPV